MTKEIIHMISIKYIFYSIVLITFILTVMIAVTTRLPMAEDISFHLEIAKDYYQGRSMSEVMEETKIPYPPLFHYILLIGIWLKIPLLFPLMIQVFLYPLALLSVGLVSKKCLSWKHSVLIVLFLIGSWGFMDRTIQVQPQAFDMILFPLSVYFFLEKKKIMFILNSAVMFQIHSYYSLVLFSAFCLYFLFRRKNIDIIVISLVTFIPVLLMTYPALLEKFDYTMATTESQEKATKNPMFILLYLGSMSVFAIPALFTADYKDDFLFLVLCWLIVLSILFILLLDRWITYITLPLSILCSVFVLKIKNDTIRTMLISAVVMVAILYIGSYFQQTILGGWHIDTEHLLSIVRDGLY